MVVHTGHGRQRSEPSLAVTLATLAAASGARATFTFSGTQARWIGFKDSYAGIAKIYVDGVPKAQVDTYSHESQANVVLFTTAMLTAGTHTLTIEATATRNASSGGNWIWVDAFESNSDGSGTGRGDSPSPLSIRPAATWLTTQHGPRSAARSSVAVRQPRLHLAGDRATFTFTGTKARDRFQRLICGNREGVRRWRPSDPDRYLLVYIPGESCSLYNSDTRIRHAHAHDRGDRYAERCVTWKLGVGRCFRVRGLTGLCLKDIRVPGKHVVAGFRGCCPTGINHGKPVVPSSQRRGGRDLKQISPKASIVRSGRGGQSISDHPVCAFQRKLRDIFLM